MRLKVADTAKKGQMRLGAWKSYISDTGKLNMSESKRERERAKRSAEREQRLAKDKLNT